ncbi:MAG TPA: MarR family transcriptional regulator [Candidatus Limnocylindrales bacterium]|nr:MarR family transcriptional regulator [Candidatus Limnocylindrales bacterium]
MTRDNVTSVLRALRRVNLQGSFFGQTVAIRFGLSESDIETLEQLIDMGATTAGKLSEITGLTSGAVTRVVDRLEQAGFVRRVPDPVDRRRVIVEVVPEKVASVQSTLDRIGTASAKEIGRYTDQQLALITDFLTRMEQVTRDEATTLRETPGEAAADASTVSSHRAPLGGLTEARLHIRSGLSGLRLRPGTDPLDLYRATFEGATPQVRLRDGRVFVGYRGLPFDWRKRVASFELNTTIPWSIEIVGGIQRVEADLRSVAVRRVEITGGMERVQLELGPPPGETGIRLVGGARTIRLERPADVPVRVTSQGGAASFVLDGTRVGKQGGQATLESPGWSRTGNRYQVEVVGGTQSIEVVGRP